MAEALPVAEQAWKLGEESPEPLLRAITRFALARVLAASRRDPPRALELAAGALEGLSGPEDASTRGVVERWLLEQKAPRRAGGRP